MTNYENILSEAKLLIVSIANDYLTAVRQPKGDCFDPDGYKKNWLVPTKHKMLGVVNMAEVLLGDDSCIYPVFEKYCKIIEEA